MLRRRIERLERRREPEDDLVAVAAEAQAAREEIERRLDRLASRLPPLSKEERAAAARRFDEVSEQIVAELAESVARIKAAKARWG